VQDMMMRAGYYYYRKIKPPDLLVVLKLAPETAVQRKTDENPVSVRNRNSEIWETDWEHKGAFVIDAGCSREEVQAQLRAIIWDHLSHGGI